MNKLIYVCSPYRGEVERNKKYARYAGEYLINRGDIPIIPHLYITEILNDDNPQERRKGMNICKQLIDKCEELIIFCNYGISKGMYEEIKYAEEHCKKISYLALKNKNNKVTKEKKPNEEK